MRIIRLGALGLIGLIGIGVVIYLLGPTPSFEKVTTTPISLDYTIDNIDLYIDSDNLSEPTLKEDNGAAVEWADSVGVKTKYSLLFLHGFSGTHHEANPLHRDFGKRYGMNTYLHRIVDHGISDKNAFKDLTPQELIKSAKEGIAIAKLLGEQVIIMSCSTGGTYAAFLAQEDDIISHLIFLSPNIAIYTSSAGLVTGPWGEMLLSQMFGDYRKINQPEAAIPYWQTEYHTDGILALQALIDQTMTEEVFQNIDQPTYIGCYYKDEENQDFVVSVAAMRSFYETISTPSKDKTFVEFPNVGNHVIGSPIKSKDVNAVRNSVFDFGDRYFKVVD